MQREFASIVATYEKHDLEEGFAKFEEVFDREVANILKDPARQVPLQSLPTSFMNTIELRESDKLKDRIRNHNFNMYTALGGLTRANARIEAHIGVLGEAFAKSLASLVFQGMAMSILFAVPGIAGTYIDAAFETLARAHAGVGRSSIVYELMEDVHGMMLSIESFMTRVRAYTASDRND